MYMLPHITTLFQGHLFDNDYEIESKYHHYNLYLVLFNNSYLEFTRWHYYSEYVFSYMIERELRYFKITEPADKKDVLIIYKGKEIARLEKSLPNLPGDWMNTIN